MPIYRNKHQDTSLLDIYNSLNMDKLENVRDICVQVFTIFGSAYICEQTFFTMNLNKNKQLSSVTGDHLEDILKTSTSNISS
jgi:hypothetical protein